MTDSSSDKWEPPVDPLLRSNVRPPAPAGRSRHSSPSTSKRRHPARGARALALAASVAATVGIAGAMARATTQSDATAADGSERAPDSATDLSASGSTVGSVPSVSAQPSEAGQPSADLDDSTVGPSEDGSQLHRRQGRGRHEGVDATTDPGESADAQTEVADPDSAPETIDSLPDEPLGEGSPSSSVWSDGAWTGTAEYTEWGDVQVEATISDGRLVDVVVLQAPSDRKSTTINDGAVPILEAQAVDLQSADLDIVSGATYTSGTYADSLQAALDQAALARGG